ncbi:aminoglycoside phosphotransferase family protein [Pseudooctadecabacter sp.]|uniref:aminoglycoside phosphotransferase family protein n=1 Tax=Pseudooctadecabacter sp. TaxID=1966338 RepID=UPI0035C78C97
MRSEQVADWLDRQEWGAWNRAAITGDASARRYERLTGPNGSTVIFMDAPPDTCGSQSLFVTIARHLRAAGLCAPEVLAHDDTLGLLVLGDLGQTDFASHLKAQPSDEAALYSAAVDVLLRLADVSAIDGLTTMTPQVAAQMLGPAFDWACKDPSAALRSEIEDELQSLFAKVDPAPSTLSLRDFHAENLIWRPDQDGTDRVGLLDFQDAFITHKAYDLASLLRDARRDVSEDLLPDLLSRLDPEADQDHLRTTFHVMAVQRNLRILGIFQRLAKDACKPRYLDFVPRVTSHLRRDLAHPALATLRPLAIRAFLGGTE